jgi:hypothetical protein
MYANVSAYFGMGGNKALPFPLGKLIIVGFGGIVNPDEFVPLLMRVLAYDFEFAFRRSSVALVQFVTQIFAAKCARPLNDPVYCIVQGDGIVAFVHHQE